MNSQRCRGFTLLEVMIALIIFAICATSLIQQSGRSLQQASQLETRTLANWIAENELERLRLAPQFPPVGTHSLELTFGQRQWLVTRTISTTSQPDLRRALIQVQQANVTKANTADYQLTGFLGRY